MEIKIQAKELSARLKTATKVINTKNSLPILNDVLLETKNGVLLITASDSEQWLSQKCSIISCDQELRFCVEATSFTNAISNIGDMPLTISLDEQTHTITCDYGNGKFSIPYEDAQEFPLSNTSDEDVKDFIVDGKKILKAIEKTGFATANDELRPVMNGINFEFCKDAMIVAASDGQKLARYTDNTITHDNDETYSFVLPAKVSVVVKSLLSAFNCDIKVSFTDKAVSFSSKEFKLTARLTEGRFPNYKSVIPQTYNVSAEIDKQNIVTALKRVLPMGSTSSELVLLRFADMKLVISTEDIDFSKSASETITCDYSTTNAPITIGFKGSSLLQIIQNLDGENAVFELTDPARAAVIYDSDKNVYLSLIMPMLIQ